MKPCQRKDAQVVRKIYCYAGFIGVQDLGLVLGAELSWGCMGKHGIQRPSLCNSFKWLARKWERVGITWSHSHLVSTGQELSEPTSTNCGKLLLLPQSRTVFWVGHHGAGPVEGMELEEGLRTEFRMSRDYKLVLWTSSSCQLSWLDC